jgi:hypothetical protein
MTYEEIVAARSEGKEFVAVFNTVNWRPMAQTTINIDEDFRQVEICLVVFDELQGTANLGVTEYDITIRADESYHEHSCVTTKRYLSFESSDESQT